MANELHPPKDELLGRAARMHLREGRPQAAQALVGAWLQRAPTAAAPHALQALVELGNGQPEHARTHAQNAVAADAHCAVAFFALAHVYLAEGRLGDASTAAQRAHALAPHEAEFSLLLGQLHASAGDGAQAERLLRLALSEAPGDARIRLALAQMLMSRPQTELREIEQIVQRGCEDAPHMASAWALYAAVRAAREDWTGARTLLELALELEPDHPIFLQQLAALCLNDPRGQASTLQRAAELARRVTVLAPQEWRAAALLAQALCRQGDWTGALKVLADASKVFPRQGELLLDLAAMCTQIGQIAAAQEAIERAAALGMPAAALARARSDCLLCQGDLVGACLALEPIHAPVPGARASLSLPLDVEAVRGQVIELVAQSVGQCLLFVRYALALEGLGASVSVVAPEPLAPLLARAAGVAYAGKERADARWQEPMLRLPALLQSVALAHRAPSAYLCADADLVAHVRRRRADHGGACLVIDLGEDSPASRHHELSAWLTRHAALVVCIGVERPRWMVRDGHCIMVASSEVELLAAWVAVADRVISTDRPLAHLAGGMDKGGDVLLALGSDPVWGLEPATTALYPSLRLHRECLDGGWSAAWRTLEASLAGTVDASAPSSVREAAHEGA